MKINNLQKHQKIFIFSILIVSAIAFLDIQFMNSNLFADAKDYVLGNYTVGLWDLFFRVGILLITLSSLGYYWFAHRDKSESISLFLSSASLWLLFGASDLLFFIFQGQMVPLTLPWLDAGYIGKLSSLIGFPHVTNISLYILVGIGLLLNYFLIKILVKKF